MHIQKPPPIYARALKLAQDPDEHFIELGRLLLTIHEDHRPLLRGWIKRSGISRRKAYYMIAIARAFEAYGVKKERLAAIGWTKLQIIAPHVQPDNIEDLLTLAETRTARRLKAEFRTDLETSDTRCVLFYFSPEDYARLEAALLKRVAGKFGRGLVDKEKALMRLVDEKPKG